MAEMETGVRDEKELGEVDAFYVGVGDEQRNFKR